METTLETPTTAATGNYAGFWIRLLAYLIDGIILLIVYGIVITAFGMGAMSSGTGDLMTDLPAMMAGAGLIMQLVLAAIGLLYFALMEASAKQGTFGKMVLNLKVVGQDGQRIGVGQAIIRYIGKIISGMIFMIGFIMAGFTDKKRALHDMIAGTYVMKK